MEKPGTPADGKKPGEYYAEHALAEEAWNAALEAVAKKIEEGKIPEEPYTK
jgi:hypothetical protein